MTHARKTCRKFAGPVVGTAIQITSIATTIAATPCAVCDGAGDLGQFKREPKKTSDSKFDTHHDATLSCQHLLLA